jgi:hypothetical protein
MSTIVTSANIIPSVTAGVFDISTSYTDDGLGIQHSPSSILRKCMLDVETQLNISSEYNEDWYVYVSFTPDSSKSKQNIIALFDMIGKKEAKLSDNTVVEYPGIEIYIRSNDYEDGFEKAKTIETFLDILENKLVEINGIAYTICNVERLAPIASLGRLENASYMYAFTLNILLNLKRYFN